MIINAKHTGATRQNNNFLKYSPFHSKPFAVHNPKQMRIFSALLLLYAILAPLNAQLRLEIICSPRAEGGLINHTNAVEKELSRKLTEDEPLFTRVTELADSLSLEKYLSDLIDSLHYRAFLEASIDSMVYTPQNATAYLHKGRQYRRVQLYPGHLDEQALRTLNIRRNRYEGVPLSIGRFRNLQQRILNHYENTGYPFASVSLADMEINEDTIRGRLVIEKNRYYRIDSIHIYGDAQVNSKYLYRHIGILPGDHYSEERFRKAGERIRQTAFLSKIREPEMEFMKESADLYLYVDRRRASNFSGILGIIPGDGDGKTRFAGEINLSLLNVFRRMESISLQWQSPGKRVQEMDLELGQPYLLGKAFGIDLHLHMFRQDSTYMKVETEAGVPFTIPGRGVVRVFAKNTSTSLIDAGGQVSALNAPAAGVSGQVFGLSYTHQQIDNRINPYRGWAVNASIGAGNKRVNPPRGYENERIKSSFVEAVARLRWFIPVSPAGTFMLANLSGIKMNIGQKKSANYFFANELFLLGGLHSIRGFDERSLAASAYSIQRVEYRYLFDAAGNMFLFFDGMAYERRLPDGKVYDMPFGFGGGLTFDTRAGQFSISYALGREFGNPVSLRSSRVHMGIINRF